MNALTLVLKQNNGSEKLLNEQLKKNWQFSSAIERLDRDP